MKARLCPKTDNSPDLGEFCVAIVGKKRQAAERALAREEHLPEQKASVLNKAKQADADAQYEMIELSREAEGLEF